MNAIGSYSVRDLLGATAADRDHIYNLLVEAEGGRAQTLRDILETKNAQGPQVKKPRSFQEAGL